MATFKATILKKDVKEGDKPNKAYNVKIRVTHERKVSYISTPYNVKKSTLTKDLELKERDILRTTDGIIDGYSKSLYKLGKKIQLYNAKQLGEWLVNESTIIEIDFINFSQDYIDTLHAKGNKGNADNLRTALNALKDFFQRDSIPIEDITSQMLERLERYLLSEHVIKREYRPGIITERTMPPVKNVFDHMRRIRQLFYACRDEYNNEDTGDIKIFHNPFKRYKIPTQKVADKRNFPVETIKAIRDLTDIPPNGKKTTNLCELGQKVFMLSFYLVGINSVDLYNATEYKNGRLNYKRTKTKTRRKDEARTSIKVEPEALPYFEEFKDKTGKRVFNFYQRYKNYRIFNKALNDGIKQVAELLIERGVDIIPHPEYYHARGSWSSIASNECGISTANIGFALNHVIPEHETTNLYIATDFTKIDRWNRQVLDTLK